MNTTHSFEEISAQLILVLPNLRRYARSLTGTQISGDNYAEATLELLRVQGATVMSEKSSIKIALFHAFHAVWTAEGAPSEASDDATIRKVQSYLNSVTPLSREALLLNTVEEFTDAEVGEILDIDEAAVVELLKTAHSEMRSAISGSILLIEDEPVIAMELEKILTELGHSVIGAAATHQQAIKLADVETPDLIVSDIQLADGSSGIDAVHDILSAAGEIPVIFITAFPERLTTGTGTEPAFVIPKPYNDVKVMSAVSQAMFFADSAAIQA